MRRGKKPKPSPFRFDVGEVVRVRNPTHWSYRINAVARVFDIETHPTLYYAVEFRSNGVLRGWESYLRREDIDKVSSDVSTIHP